jgi:hypothetical protein
MTLLLSSLNYGVYLQSQNRSELTSNAGTMSPLGGHWSRILQEKHLKTCIEELSKSLKELIEKLLVLQQTAHPRRLHQSPSN